MNSFLFDNVTESEYDVIVLCSKILQNNISCFNEPHDRLLVSSTLPHALLQLEKKGELTAVEFTTVLHAIELCALALKGLEKIPSNDLNKIRPYKKIILSLYHTYGKILYI